MLINFAATNWKSFRDKTPFTMVPVGVRTHNDRIAKFQSNIGGKRHSQRVLPTTAIYGGNASGKSNFVDALDFMKFYVVSMANKDEGTGITPFALDDTSRKAPSTFEIEFLAGKIVYRFMFSLSRERVLEESLEALNICEGITLYSRNFDSETNSYEFNPINREDAKVYFRNIEPPVGTPSMDKLLGELDLLKIFSDGTGPAQLFLNNASSQRISLFSDVYHWFHEILMIVRPDSKPLHVFKEHFKSRALLLSQLDTGIKGIRALETPLDKFPLPDIIKRDIKEGFRRNTPPIVLDSPYGTLRVEQKGDSIDSIVVLEEEFLHQGMDGKDIYFKERAESDGTQRLMDLTPMLLRLMEPSSKRVFVVDEIDRSLHSHMSRALLELFLDGCSRDGRAQLIFTTHDTTLMTQELFRRDEMWLTDRHMDGTTKLAAISDFVDIRNDKDLRKLYLRGALGGTPNIATIRELLFRDGDGVGNG